MSMNVAMFVSLLSVQCIVHSTRHLLDVKKPDKNGSLPSLRRSPSPHQGDISCHYWSSLEPALPVVDGHFAPPERSIFFHETSCKGRLDFRQGCAVESAARENPDWQVYVLFSGEVSRSALFDDVTSALSRLPNVHLYRVKIAEYLEGTGAAALADALPDSRFPVAHASDVLRYATLHKFGGVYLDLDVVVARALAPLGADWAAREPGDPGAPGAAPRPPDAGTVGAAALAMSRSRVGREVARAALGEIAGSFRGDLWSDNGPLVITSVLRRRCNASDARAMNRHRCRGFQVYESELVYPLHYRRAREYLQAPRRRSSANFSDASNLYQTRAGAPPARPYLHHTYHACTWRLRVHARSAYAQLARRHCPATFAEYDQRFGT